MLITGQEKLVKDMIS